jgi:hypothetical protein
MESYEKLKIHLPEIAKIVETFPPTLQEKVYQTMISELLGKTSFDAKEKIETKKEETKEKLEISDDLSAIATFGPDGQYHSSIRDLKAKNAKDAAKRLVYVLIRSYTKLMKTDTVSRKDLINPELTKWRLSNANTRGLIANDPGIIKQGDSFSLDQHAQKEADDFICEINNPEIVGSWKIGSSKRQKRKKSDTELQETTLNQEIRDE